MQVQEENAPFDDINVTPMLDLAYVLLVIFIIMTTASVQGVKVQLPKAKMAGSMAKPHLKAITISEAGDIFIDAYPVAMDQLEDRLRALKSVNPSQAVVIFLAHNAPFNPPGHRIGIEFSQVTDHDWKARVF